MTLFLPTSYGSHWSHLKKIWKFWIIKKKKFLLWHQRAPFWNFFLKNWKNCFFFKKSNFFKLNLNSTCSKLSFKVHNIEFVQNFEIFIFLAKNFSSMTNFIPWPLAAKLIIKKTKTFIFDQVLPSRWHVSWVSKLNSTMQAQSAPLHVLMHLPEPIWNGLIKVWARKNGTHTKIGH